ncbi:MAG TPA: hypothetical protein VF208_08950, partial [Candidatus Binatia bacterium]
RAALSKLKLMSFSGLGAAGFPVCSSSKLVLGAGFGAAGFGAAGFGFSAGRFSPVHFGGGGFAGLPHETKKVIANNFNPLCKIRFCSLIETTFPAPSWTDLMGQL